MDLSTTDAEISAYSGRTASLNRLLEKSIAVSGLSNDRTTKAVDGLLERQQVSMLEI